MSKHTVSIENFTKGEWFNTAILASSVCKGENKRLYVESIIKDLKVASRFVVTSHGETRYSGGYLDIAIRTYNEA